MHYNPLVLLVSIPIIAGILCVLLPDKLKIVIKLLALTVTLFTLALSTIVFVIRPISWQYASSTILSADNLSSFIACAIAFFAFLVSVYSFGYIEKGFGRYFGCILITLGSSFAVALAVNLIVLLAFWLILTVMLYPLVNNQGARRRASSAQKAIIIIGATDVIMMFGIYLIWTMTKTFSMQDMHLELKGIISYAAYFSLAIASLSKAGAMPFHSWIPDVAKDAQASVTAYLPASLDKLLGIYLLARLSLDMFIMNGISNLILLLVGSATIVLAALFAFAQHDLKRLLGYYAISQAGYMVLGIGTGTAVGIAGGLFHMLNDAVYKSCLFLAGGAVEKKTNTTDLSNLGGLAKYMPITFASFLIAALSISAVPPFNGFVSKWMIYQGIIASASARDPLWIVWLVCAMFGSTFTVASFMKLLHAIFLGRPSRDYKNVQDVGFAMSFPMAILASICFIFGVFAFLLPLPLFIMPAIGHPVAYLGIWSPIIATVLIIIGIAAGLSIYLAFKPRRFRRTATFVGGEDADKLERISGVEFYNTIKEIKALGLIYRKEKTKEKWTS